MSGDLAEPFWKLGNCQQIRKFLSDFIHISPHYLPQKFYLWLKEKQAILPLLFEKIR